MTDILGRAHFEGAILNNQPWRLENNRNWKALILVSGFTPQYFLSSTVRPKAVIGMADDSTKIKYVYNIYL
jgi:hypothetical protein